VIAAFTSRGQSKLPRSNRFAHTQNPLPSQTKHFTRLRALLQKQAQLMRLAIANYRKPKKLLRTWETHTRRLIELNASE